METAKEEMNEEAEGIDLTPEQIQKIKEIIWNWALRKAKRELAEKKERDRKAG